MKSVSQTLLSCWLLLMCAGLADTSQAHPLRFGLTGFQSPQSHTLKWQQIIDDLGLALGSPVEIVAFDDYAGSVWALRSGDIQVAIMGNKSAVEAVDRAQAEVGLIQLNDEGSPFYHALLIARADASVHSVQDMYDQAPQLTFGFGDPNSTSGRIIPGHYLFALPGIEPMRLFQRVVVGNHEANARGVADGRLDVATNNDQSLERLRRADPETFAKIRVIWSSPPIPFDPIVWRKDLPEATKTLLRRFFTDYGQPSPGKGPKRLAQERERLFLLSSQGFQLSDDHQLDLIRIMDLEGQEVQTQADPSLSAEQKASRLEALADRLRALRDARPKGATSP